MNKHSILIYTLAFIQCAYGSQLATRVSDVSADKVQDRPGQPLNIARSVDDAMQTWQGNAGITLVGDAQSAVQKDFVQNQAMLREILDRRAVGDTERAQLLHHIVDYYLYDVRDLAIKAQLRRMKSEKTKPMIGDPGINPNTHPAYFAKSPPYGATSGDRVTQLEIMDVDALRVSKFLDSNATVFNGDTGELAVSSNPDYATIRIDGKDKGFTNRTYVVSAGTHDVSTDKPSDNLHCHHRIDVPTNTTKTFDCP